MINYSYISPTESNHTPSHIFKSYVRWHKGYLPVPWKIKSLYCLRYKQDKLVLQMEAKNGGKRVKCVLYGRMSMAAGVFIFLFSVHMNSQYSTRPNNLFRILRIFLCIFYCRIVGFVGFSNGGFYFIYGLVIFQWKYFVCVL